MRYGKYYAVISLVSCEPIWGTVTCPGEQAGEQAVKGEKAMQVTMEKQVFLHYMPSLFPGLSNL